MLPPNPNKLIQGLLLPPCGQFELLVTGDTPDGEL